MKIHLDVVTAAGNRLKMRDLSLGAELLSTVERAVMGRALALMPQRMERLLSGEEASSTVYDLPVRLSVELQCAAMSALKAELRRMVKREGGMLSVNGVQITRIRYVYPSEFDGLLGVLVTEIERHLDDQRAAAWAEAEYSCGLREDHHW